MIAINEKANRTKVLAAVAVLAMVACVFVAMPVDETDAAGNDITYVSGVIDKNMTFYDGNKVVVDKDLDITNGAVLEIQSGAQFTVNEGVTVTVDGLKADTTDVKATLKINDGSTVTVNGSLEVGRNGAIVNDNAVNPADTEDKTGFYVNGGITVVRNGEISGTNAIDTDSETVSSIILGSSATLETQSSGKNHAVIENQAIIMAAGSSVTLNGDFNNLAILAYSANSEFNGGAMITGVIPEGDNITTSYTKLKFSVSVTDQTVYVADEKNPGESVQKTVKATILDVSGTTMEGTTLFIVAGETANDCYQDEDMKISALGTVAISSSLNVVEGSQLTTVGNLNVTGTLRVNGIAAFGGAVTVATGATVTVAPVADEDASVDEVIIAGVVYVSGNLVITPAEGATVDVSSAYLNITSGTATIADYNKTLAGFSGAFYIDDENGNAYFSEFAAALAAAVEANAFDVYVGGYAAVEGVAPETVYEITSDITVSGVDLYVENKVQINEGVTLTIDGDSINSDNGGLFVVKGTLVDNADSGFEDEASSVVPSSGVAIDAEVRSTDEDETYYSYTTLANALSGMTSGTVSLFGEVTVDQNLEIPAGVTVDTNGKDLVIGNNVELTINGVVELTTNGDITYAPVEGKDAKQGTVAVNNYIVGTNLTTYSAMIPGFYAAGAIGETEGDFIMSAAVAQDNAAELGNIAVYGPITTGDLSFANAGETAKTITVYGTYTSGTITIDGYNVIFAAGATYNGTIANAEGSVALANINGITVSDATVEDADRLTVTGTPGKITGTDGKDLKSAIVFAGTVYVGQMDLTYLGDMTAPAGATVNMAGIVTNVNNLTVEGTMGVLSGADVTANVLNVTGTVTVVAEADGNAAGVLKVESVYAGITKDDVDNGKAVAATSASIDGTVTIQNNGYAYVAPGATLSEGFTEGMNSAEFSVEGAVWFTVYSNSEAVAVTKAPINDGYFLGWATEQDGDVVHDAESEVAWTAIPLRADGVTYYSVGDYDIYTVTVVADDGVGAIYIGGVVLQKTGNTFVTMFPMTAGVKEISVVAKSGFNADNVEITGTGVSGNNLTLSGTTNTDIVLYVTGTEAVTGQGTVVTVSGDDGMGLTDYLLIILVVLVVVMAILVATRLMRS